MKFVLILEERKIYSSEEYPVKILENYITIADKPKQIVIFEAKDSIELAKFIDPFKDTPHQLIPIIDAKEYDEKIGTGQIRGIYGAVGTTNL